jgi:hypothetical protein
MALFCLLGLVFGAYAQGFSVIPGHAHNDYEHDRPLREALQNGFRSVEVDVHLVNGELYVAHDQPTVPDPTRSLEALYLKPLQEWIDTHGGRIYPGYDETFFLLVDIKSGAGATYVRLKSVLQDYAAVFFNGRPSAGIAPPVTVVISGSRPVEQLLQETSSHILLDGRPADLADKVPAGRMPIVSENCRLILDWDGRQEPSKLDHRRLRALVSQTHRQGKLLRLWGAPDHPRAWTFLLDNGVDLINTDRIADFRAFYQAYSVARRE